MGLSDEDVISIDKSAGLVGFYGFINCGDHPVRQDKPTNQTIAS